MNLRWLLLAFACAPAPAQNAQEVATRDAQPTFSTRVNLVMVPVVVRDKNGRATGNLTKEDFQLTDRGKVQYISRFSVEKASARLEAKPIQVEKSDEPLPAAEAIANRFILFLFDDMHLDAGDLARTREAARKHLSKLGESERAAIFTTSGRTMLDFTDDRESIDRTLLQIRPYAQIRASECPRMNFYTGDLIQNKNDQRAISAATDDALACAGMTPDMRPQAQQLALAAAQRVLAQGNSENQVALSVLKDSVRRLAASPGQRTLVLVSPGFFVTLDYRPEESEILDRAIRANVVMNSIDARGLYVTGQDLRDRGDAGSVASAVAKSMYELEAARADADLLGEVAYGTGGTFFQNNNDFEEGFRRVSALPEFVYILGFAPQNLKYDGAYHAIKVSIRAQKSLTLEARRGYYAPKHALDAAQQTRQEMTEALFSRDETQEIPVDLQTQFFKPSLDQAKVAIVAKIDLRPLHFHKEDGRSRNDLVVLAGIFDRNGNLVSALEKTVEMRLKDDTFEARVRAGLAMKTNFDLTPGNYVVRVVVRDTEGQLMTARNGVVRIP